MVSVVVVTRLARRSDLGPIVRAALEIDIVYVPLPESPPGGRCTLRVDIGDQTAMTVAAELVGSGRDGEYPMRLRLLDESQRSELEAMVDRKSLAPEERRSMAPRPSRSFADIAVSEDSPTLGSRNVQPPPRPSVPVSVALPHPANDEPETPGPILEPIVPDTMVFSPQELLAERQKVETGSEDSVTLPRPSSHASSARRQAVSVPPPQPNRPKRSSIRSDPNDPLCGRRIGDGKYVLDTQIGGGAVGLVFKASHRDLGRTVAIKVLKPRYRDEPDLLRVFKTEARAASLLEHPNIARVYDFGQEPDGLVYIVMEYLSGYTLGTVLDPRKRIAFPRTVDIMLQTCAGLSAAHDRGIVHRDIKPENIVLVPTQDDEGNPSEIVKVCDFGIAALGTAASTAQGGGAGSPEYMAPEQQMTSAVSAAADVYACGVVLYEMTTGQVPFTDPQPYRILMKHQSEVPTAPSTLEPEIPKSLEAVIMRCLEKDPTKRHQTARALRADLRKLGELR